MSKIEINRITNANIYLDGTNLLGRAEEVKLPDVSMIMQEHKALGTFKQHENAEFSSSFTCTYIRQVLDGEELLQLDYLANIFRVGGVDQLTDYRINIGG